MRRLAAHLRSESGTTLVEMLTALVIGSVVLFGVVTVFTTALTSAAKVNDRVDAAQRARLALDRMQTVLDCIDHQFGDARQHPLRIGKAIGG